MFTPDRNTVGSRTLTTPRPHLTLIGLSTRWRAPLPSRLLVFTSCGPTFLPTPPPLLPSCLPISLFSITGVRILLLGSRSPIRHYYRHRAPVGVLVNLDTHHIRRGKEIYASFPRQVDPWEIEMRNKSRIESYMQAHALKNTGKRRN